MFLGVFNIMMVGYIGEEVVFVVGMVDLINNIFIFVFVVLFVGVIVVVV